MSLLWLCLSQPRCVFSRVVALVSFTLFACFGRTAGFLAVLWSLSVCSPLVLPWSCSSCFCLERRRRAFASCVFSPFRVAPRSPLSPRSYSALSRMPVRVPPPFSLSFTFRPCRTALSCSFLRCSRLHQLLFVSVPFVCRFFSCCPSACLLIILFLFLCARASSVFVGLSFSLLMSLFRYCSSPQAPKGPKSPHKFLNWGVTRKVCVPPRFPRGPRAPGFGGFWNPNWTTGEIFLEERPPPRTQLLDRTLGPDPCDAGPQHICP